MQDNGRQNANIRRAHNPENMRDHRICVVVEMAGNAIGNPSATQWCFHPNIS